MTAKVTSVAKEQILRVNPVQADHQEHRRCAQKQALPISSARALKLQVITRPRRRKIRSSAIAAMTVNAGRVSC